MLSTDWITGEIEQAPLQIVSSNKWRLGISVGQIADSIFSCKLLKFSMSLFMLWARCWVLQLRARLMSEPSRLITATKIEIMRLMSAMVKPKGVVERKDNRLLKFSRTGDSYIGSGCCLSSQKL